MMNDRYEYLMTNAPEIQYHDVPIQAISLSDLMPFADANGNFTESFDVTLTGQDFIREIWILSSIAKYTSVDGKYPMVQVRIINEEGKTLYYAPPYIIGHEREFYRREWRIPPTTEHFQTVRISFMIPSGVVLSIRQIRNKRNTRSLERDIGIRFHGHAGFPGYAPSNTVPSYQMAAEMGFCSCITIPKFTKDGLGICFHDDASVRRPVRYPDGTCVQEGSPDDKPVSEYTYEELMQFDIGIRKGPDYEGTRIPTMEEFFRICSMTGMQPIFSVHPDLTRDQWLYVKDLLKKYRLLEHFWIKSGRPGNNRIATEVFDDQIAGYIMIQGLKSDWDPLENAKKCGFDLNRHKVVMEFFYLSLTEEKVKRALEEGFHRVSVATTKGGFSGPGLQELIDMGVSEFTLDHHCSMGLSW